MSVPYFASLKVATLITNHQLLTIIPIKNVFFFLSFFFLCFGTYSVKPPIEGDGDQLTV